MNHTSDFYSAIRGGIESYLGRKLSDAEFQDVRSKIDVIERGAVLQDANFVIGDVLIRRFDQSKSEWDTEISRLKKWWGVFGLTCFIIIMALVASTTYELGRVASSSEAQRDSWTTCNGRLITMLHTASSEIDRNAGFVRQEVQTGQPFSEKQFNDFVSSCSDSINEAVALNKLSDAYSPSSELDWRTWLYIFVLALPAFSLATLLGYQLHSLLRK